MIRRFPLVLAALALCASCNIVNVVGNGRLVQEQRTIGAFTEVRVSNGLRAEITRGPTRLELNLDDNIAPLVRTEVQGTLLVVEAKNGQGFEPSAGAVVRIAGPAIHAVSVSGTSSATAALTGDEITLDASGESKLITSVDTASSASVQTSGASELTLSGSVHRLVVDSSGQSTVSSAPLSDEAEITASGQVEVTVHASLRVRVRASGQSQVTVRGEPATRDVETSGDAKINFPR